MTFAINLIDYYNEKRQSAVKIGEIETDTMHFLSFRQLTYGFWLLVIQMAFIISTFSPFN